MSIDEKRNNLIYSKKRKMLEEKISENPIYRSMTSSLVNEGINIELEEFVDKYIAVLGRDNLENDAAFDFVELNKFIIGTINHISKEKNGIVLNDDGTKNDAASIQQKLDIIYDASSDYAELDEKFSEKNQNIFFLKDISEEEKAFYENFMSGNATSYDIYDNLQYQTSNNADKVLSNAENNRLETFIETKEQLDLIIMCAKHDNASSVDEKKQYLDKISKLSYVQKFVDSQFGEIDINAVLSIGKNWRENHLKGRRKMDLLDYSKLRESGKNFYQLSDEDKNRVLRSAVKIFENKEASLESRKIAFAALIDISPELVESSKDKNGNILSKINKEILLEKYNTIHQEEKSVESVDEILSIFSKEENALVFEKLDEISKAKSLMTYEEWQKISIAREKKILDESKKIELSEVNGIDLNMGEENNSNNKSNSSNDMKSIFGKTIRKLVSPFTNLISRIRTPKLQPAVQVQEIDTVTNQNKIKKEEYNPFFAGDAIVAKTNAVSQNINAKSQKPDSIKRNEDFLEHD